MPPFQTMSFLIFTLSVLPSIPLGQGESAKRCMGFSCQHEVVWLSVENSDFDHVLVPAPLDFTILFCTRVKWKQGPEHNTHPILLLVWDIFFKSWFQCYCKRQQGKASVKDLEGFMLSLSKLLSSGRVSQAFQTQVNKKAAVGQHSINVHKGGHKVLFWHRFTLKTEVYYNKTNNKTKPTKKWKNLFCGIRFLENMNVSYVRQTTRPHPFAMLWSFLSIFDVSMSKW